MLRRSRPTRSRSASSHMAAALRSGGECIFACHGITVGSTARPPANLSRASNANWKHAIGRPNSDSRRRRVMDIVVQLIVNGLLLGGVLALSALGFNIIFGVMRVVNLAHGDLVVIAALTCAMAYAH